MDAVQEINELFEADWFRKVIESSKKIIPFGFKKPLNELTLEEQVDWVRNCSIHGQTHFFREPILHPILEHLVIPSFERRPVRIASVGCSDGREVYSMLIHFWKRKNELVLHGYDSNPELITEARDAGEGIPGPAGGYH